MYPSLLDFISTVPSSGTSNTGRATSSMEGWLADISLMDNNTGSLVTYFLLSE